MDTWRPAGGSVDQSSGDEDSLLGFFESMDSMARAMEEELARGKVLNGPAKSGTILYRTPRGTKKTCPRRSKGIRGRQTRLSQRIRGLLVALGWQGKFSFLGPGNEVTPYAFRSDSVAAARGKRLEAKGKERVDEPNAWKKANS